VYMHTMRGALWGDDISFTSPLAVSENRRDNDVREKMDTRAIIYCSIKIIRYKMPLLMISSVTSLSSVPQLYRRLPACQ
jgi:hypothetical protein